MASLPASAAMSASRTAGPPAPYSEKTASRGRPPPAAAGTYGAGRGRPLTPGGPGSPARAKHVGSTSSVLTGASQRCPAGTAAG
jgi:hypothetical protein